MERQDVTVVVIGAGVVGLAVGRALARRGTAVAVIERNSRAAQETSARHSGVLHSGLYYPTGSLKARACVEGRRRLVAFCERHAVSHRVCGKLIVSNDDEEAGLQRLLEQGLANGVEQLARVTAAQIRRREPNVIATAGLLCAATGIVSSDELAAALERQLLAHGGVLLLGQEVVGLTRRSGGWTVRVRPARGDSYEFGCERVINAAGLWAGQVAGLAGLERPAVHYCKGDYFWTTRPVVRGLVYPLPEPGLRGLGIHTTVDLAGRIRFGPDTSWVDTLHYDVDQTKAASFARAVGRYLDGIDAQDLQPDTAGIRPKLSRGTGFVDFQLLEEPGGLLTLAGIESPGLTSCLELGRMVAEVVM